eukprot:225479-Amphidinium_carterae.2
MEVPHRSVSFACASVATTCEEGTQFASLLFSTASEIVAQVRPAGSGKCADNSPDRSHSSSSASCRSDLRIYDPALLTVPLEPA